MIATSTETAVIVAGRGSEADVATLVTTLGYRAMRITGADALQSLPESIALCLVDLKDNAEAMRVVRAVRTQHPQALLIGVADPDRPAAASDAIRAGVFDVLPRPPAARDLSALIANAREQLALSADATRERHLEAGGYGIVGTSPAMRAVMDLVARSADGRCGILIAGERGSGREMIARLIHAHGRHTMAPFIKVDCAGPSPEDVEHELFGVVGKRSSGAPERRSLERLGLTSRVHEANDGILFLENITELTARAQARLVRVLRDREVFLEDDAEPVPVDVRPIAAVDFSIDGALEEGRIRHDLFERLSLIRIDVPSLRQRREDIPVLATHFLKELCRQNGKPIKTLTRAALTVLAALPWKGNAPELRGFLERLLLLVPHGLIRLEDVLAHVQLEGSLSPTGFDATLKQARARFEREYISGVLQHHRGRIADAARALGIQRTNLYRKMRRLNVMRAKHTVRGSDVS
jgi:DNA-binding NtrC family response regulator